MALSFSIRKKKYFFRCLNPSAKSATTGNGRETQIKQRCSLVRVCRMMRSGVTPFNHGCYPKINLPDLQAAYCLSFGGIVDCLSFRGSVDFQKIYWELDPKNWEGREKQYSENAGTYKVFWKIWRVSSKMYRFTCIIRLGKKIYI